MGKAKRSDKEFTRQQKLLKENAKLKQVVAQLRKQLARLDLDRYTSVKEIIDEHYHKEESFNQEDLLEKMKQEWKCNESGCEGFLEIILYNKLESTWYFRACSECNNRTKSQKYDSNHVKGIVKKSS